MNAEVQDLQQPGNRADFACAALFVGIAALPAAAAARPTVAEQIEALRQMVERQQGQLDLQQQQIEVQRAEIEVLRAAQGKLPPPAAPEPAQRIDALQPARVESKPVSPTAATLQLRSNRAIVTSADGVSSLAVRANVQMDYAHYGQDAAGPLATDHRRGSVGAPGLRETVAARDLSDGAYFRRARLGVEGVIARNFNYRFMVEFGGSGSEGPARINDAYIAYTGLTPFAFQLGAYSPPANLADGTSTEDLLFIERPTPAELSRTLGGADGRFGVGVRVAGKRGLGALTLTGRAANEAEVFDSQQAVVGRLGGLVVTSPEYNLHLGVNGTYVFNPPDQGANSNASGVRFRDRPELRVDSTRLIDSGPIDAAQAYSAGVELAADWKGLLLQAENYWYGIERRGASLADPRFGGYYVEASWFPTGERRRYAAANAAFQAPATPLVPFDGRSGWGAWELALRYSHTDLNHLPGVPGTAADPGSVRGGEQSIFGAGLNWYLNSNVKLMFNYLRIDVDRLNPAGPGNPTPFGPSPATPPLGVNVGQEMDVYALRSQFNF